MSTSKVDAIRHNSATSDAITTASDGTCTARITGMTGGGQLSHRNLIVNGGMKLAQRSNSAAITGAGYHTVDRFKTVANSSMSYAVTMSQENDNPDGLGKSVKLLTTTAKTPSGSENYILRYIGEEQDISGAGLGTSSCKQLTVSFSVKTNKTGTHGFQIYLYGNQPNMTVAYTVSSANTWERKTITLPTYTTSYTHGADNAQGFMIDWNLSSGPDDIMAPYNWATGSSAARGVTGQVNMLDTVGNYFQLTNVQLEIGDTATSFEHRSYQDELAHCQRYFYKISAAASGTGSHKHIGTMQYYGGQYPYGKMLDLPVPMRTIPTGSFTGDIRAWTASGSNNGSFTTINFDRNDNKFLASNGSTTNQNSGGSGNATPITLYPSSTMSADAEL